MNFQSHVRCFDCVWCARELRRERDKFNLIVLGLFGAKELLLLRCVVAAAAAFLVTRVVVRALPPEGDDGNSRRLPAEVPRFLLSLVPPDLLLLLPVATLFLEPRPETGVSFSFFSFLFASLMIKIPIRNYYKHPN